MDWQLSVRIFSEMRACERCAHVPAVPRECLTAYAEETENVELVLCYICADEYKTYWENQWQEYNQSRG